MTMTYTTFINRLDKRLVCFKAVDPAQQPALNDAVKMCAVDGFNQPHGQGKMKGTASFLQVGVEAQLAKKGWIKA